MCITKILMFGPPGAGKGTAAAKLSKHLNLEHISVGDLFRSHLSRHTDIGIAIEKIMACGKLVPDEITNKMVQETVRDRYILDGYPRNTAQANFYLSFVRPDVVIFIQADDEIIKNRMMNRCRPDDIEKVIADRISVYYEQTLPAINVLRERDVPILNVNGNQTPDDAFNSIMKALAKV